MRERKYIKFRVDMLSDTKFKIIDRKPERDLIHYVWTALVLLAGKVNLEGALYMSKNIPYTIETLAIEFNREMEQVKSALDTLIELEMLELTEDSIYRVKNFSKHQNIKPKSTTNTIDKETVIRNKKAEEDKNFKNENNTETSKENKKNIISNDLSHMKTEESFDSDVNNEDTNEFKDSLTNIKSADTSKLDIISTLKKKRRKKRDQEIIFEFSDEEIGSSTIDGVYDKERPLVKGEKVMAQWTFG